ncbi:MAG: 3-isopropylmalate dehydratase small subunit [Oscillospiraceae bacterium]|jgi:3-isopropylmalate/(R)-2-methylmalate dehydratase small subunit|nr:3-isopropylmalate dehydratase small subunit [Oscillospiraceae bacterium]
MKLESAVIRYGDHVDTDVIIPARYLNTTDPKELGSHCMEDLDADFHRKAQTAHIVVAGRNFGCGSSREHAPLALKAAGIQCVVAHSFARIFFRNAINIGLPIVECPAAQALHEGDRLAVDLDTGALTNLQTGETYHAAPFPPFMQGIMQAGGLAASIRDQLVKEGKA